MRLNSELDGDQIITFTRTYFQLQKRLINSQRGAECEVFVLTRKPEVRHDSCDASSLVIIQGSSHTSQ